MSHGGEYVFLQALYMFPQRGIGLLFHIPQVANIDRIQIWLKEEYPFHGKTTSWQKCLVLRPSCSFNILYQQDVNNFSIWL